MKTVIVRGYYGRDNLGDELMKKVFIKEFRHNNINLHIMNSSPNSLFEEYELDTPEELVTGKIPSLKSIIKRIRTIVKADMFIFGGGTIITDKHSYKHMMENGVYFLLRRLLGRPSLLVSVGSTELKSRAGIFWARVLINNCTRAYIRDEESFEFLTKLSNNSSNLVQSTDIVLLTKDDIPSEEAREKSAVVGMCFMPYYSATFHEKEKDIMLENRLVDQIEIIATRHPDYKFALIPVQYGNNDATDYEFSRNILNRLKGKIDISIVDARNSDSKLKALAKCNYVISMRLHALMIAKLMNKRIFAINHNEKIQSFMRKYDSLNNTVALDDIGEMADCFEKTEETNNTSEKLEQDYQKAKEDICEIKKIIV